MTPNLDDLEAEILTHLEEQRIAIFHCDMLAPDAPPTLYWDTEHHPDFRDFVRAAVTCGARIMTVVIRRFGQDNLEEAMEQLEDSDFETRDKRVIEKSLKEMQVYKGRVCDIQLSFSEGSHDYVFDLSTPWFDEFVELQDHIESSFLHSGENDSPLGGGYFSKN